MKKGKAGAGLGKRVAQTGKVVERDLKGVNPLKEQFEPKGAEPVRAHYKMAGGV
jgi:hypothetical protein